MSTTTQNNSTTTNSSQAPVQNCDLAYGSGDAAYAPALAYAMVAKLMGEELQLSNQLKKIQSEESTDAMKSAANQAGNTRSSAYIDSVGQGVSGGMSLAQGSGSIGAESYLTGKRSSVRGKQSELNEKLRTLESDTGAGTKAQLDKQTSAKNKLKDQIKDLEAQHTDLHSKKDFFHSAIQGLGQFTQATSKAGSSIAKSNEDAKAAIEQADQQSYKQVADDIGSANQSAIQTINQFTNENFAAATAIRG